MTDALWTILIVAIVIAWGLVLVVAGLFGMLVYGPQDLLWRR